MQWPPPPSASSAATLLVGNFGDGTINAFDPVKGTQIGTLQDPTGHPLTIPGLWGLLFGNGGKGGDTSTLYFTAGIPGPMANRRNRTACSAASRRRRHSPPR